MKQAFYPLHKQNRLLRELDNNKEFFYKLFVQYLVVKPVCVNTELDQKMLSNNALFLEKSCRRIQPWCAHALVAH